MRLADLRPALAHPRFHGGEVPELARVAGEGLDLQIHHVGDVHDDVRGLPLHHVHLADLVRLEVGHELGKGQVVAREGIDAVEHDAADGAMVAMRGAEVVGTLRVLAHDEIGTVAPDLARDVTPQRSRVLDLAVGITQERDLLDAERARGIALLLGADRREPR